MDHIKSGEEVGGPEGKNFDLPVHPTLTCGHELWAVAEMSFLCKVARLILIDRVRSSDIQICCSLTMKGDSSIPLETPADHISHQAWERLQIPQEQPETLLDPWSNLPNLLPL